MNKAQDILEKLKQRREEAKAVTAYWDEVLADLGTLPSAQLQSWLGTFDLDTIIAGLDRTVIQRSKREAKDKPMDAGQAVRYASAVMHGLRLEGLPEHERREIAERKAKIRQARRDAANKRWHAPAPSSENLHDFASDLHPVARDLHASYSGSGPCSSSFSYSSSDSSYKGADAPVAASPLAAGTAGEKEEKANPKPETKTNGVRGVSANQEQNQKTNTNPGQRIAQLYKRTCKKCGEELDPNKNHVCAPKRYFDQDFESISEPARKNTLGTVDDL